VPAAGPHSVVNGVRVTPYDKGRRSLKDSLLGSDFRGQSAADLDVSCTIWQNAVRAWPSPKVTLDKAAFEW